MFGPELMDAQDLSGNAASIAEILFVSICAAIRGHLRCWGAQKRSLVLLSEQPMLMLMVVYLPR